MDEDRILLLKRLCIAAVVTVLLGAGLWISYPIYKKQMAKRALTQARTRMAQKNYREASLCARNVLSVYPAHVEAVQILASVTEAVRSPEMVKWQQRLVQLEPAVLQHRLKLARQALLYRNPALAQEALNGADATAQQSVEFHQLSALVETTLGKLDLAESHFTQAAKLSPTNHQIQLNLAVLRLQSTNPPVALAAEKSLETLSQHDDTRLEALRQLIQIARKRHGLATAESFSRQLQAAPDAGFDDRLQHLSILTDMGDAEAAPYLSTLQRVAESTPEHILALGTWMIGRKQTDQALTWLNQLPDATRQQLPVMKALAECHVAKADWPRLQSLLRDQAWGDSEPMRLALLARAGSMLGEDLTARSKWKSAVREATSNLNSLNALLQLTTLWQWESEREDLLWTIFERYPRERWALKDLELLHLVKGDTRGLYEVYVRQVSDNPKDIGAKNNLATTSLLLGTQLTDAYALAQQVYAADPNNPAYVSTAAFSFHRQGQTAEGIKILEQLPPDTLKLPAVAVYYGVLLAAAGETNKARAYLEIAKASRLLPEETALVEQALKGPEAATPAPAAKPE